MATCVRALSAHRMKAFTRSASLVERMRRPTDPVKNRLLKLWQARCDNLAFGALHGVFARSEPRMPGTGKTGQRWLITAVLYRDPNGRMMRRCAGAS